MGDSSEGMPLNLGAPSLNLGALGSIAERPSSAAGHRSRPPRTGSALGSRGSSTDRTKAARKTGFATDRGPAGGGAGGGGFKGTFGASGREVLSGVSAGGTRLSVEDYITRLYRGDRDKRMQVVHLTGDAIGNDGAMAIAGAVSANPYVKKVNMASCKIGDQGAKAIANKLKQHPSVVAVTLGTNKITDEGAKALLEMMQANERITKLDLNGNPIALSIVKQVDDLCAARAPKKEADVPRQVIEAETIKRVTESLKANSSKYVSVELSGVTVNNKTAETVADLISENTHIRELHMAGCRISDTGMLALAESLTHNDTLTHLYLANNLIGDEGGKALLDALDQAQGIYKVSLGANPMSQTIIMQIEALLKPRARARSAAYRAHRDVATPSEEEEVKPCFEDVLTEIKANHHKFKQATLTGTPLDDDEIKQLGDALVTNTSVTHLHLGNCKINDARIEVLAKALEKNTGVLQLYLANNKITDEGGRALLESLKVNTKIYRISLGANPISVTLSQEMNAVVEVRRPGKKKIEEKEQAPDIDELVAKLLGNDRHLNYIEYTGFHLSERSVKKLSEALVDNTVCTHLHFGGTRLTDASLAHLCEMLKVNRHVRQLYLSNNKLTNAGAHMLLDMLRDNGLIDKISLGANGIDHSLVSQIDTIVMARRAARSSSRMSTFSRNSSSDASSSMSYFELQSRNMEMIIDDLAENSRKRTAVDLTGIRITEEIALDLLEALEGNTHVTHLHLGSCKINDRSVVHICEALKANQSIKQLYLANNRITDEGGEMLLEAIKANENIYRISLGANPMSQMLVAEINEVCEERRPKRKHPTLDIVVEVEEEVPAWVPPDVNEVLSKVEANSPKLNAVDLTSVAVSVEDAKRLGEGLRANTVVTHLHLGSCKLDDDGIKAIADALRDNDTVKQLYLGNNKLTDVGAEYLFEVVKEKENIKKISLSGNSMRYSLLGEIEQFMNQRKPKRHVSQREREDQDVISFRELLRALSANDPNTHVVHMTAKPIGDNGVTKISEALFDNTVVTHVYLASCKITDAGVEALYDAIRTCPSLTQLNLSCNRIGDHGGGLLLDALRQNEAITKIALEGNKVSPQVLGEIYEVVAERRPKRTMSEAQARSSEKSAMSGTFGASARNTTVEVSKDIDTLDDVLDKLEAGSKSFTRVKLTGVALRTKDCAVLAEGLTDNAHVTEVHVASCKLKDEGLITLCEAFKTMPALRYINVSVNKFGDDGAQALLECVRENETIDKVNVTGMVINDNVRAELDEEIAARKTEVKSKAAEVLDKVNIMEGTFGASGRSTLEGVTLKDKKYTVEEAVRKLRKNDPKFHVLKMTGQPIGSRGAQEIAKALDENEHLTQLYLGSCKIDDKGMVALARVLQHHAAITHVGIGLNKFGEDGAMALMVMVKGNERIQKLNYESTSLVGSDLADEIEVLLKERQDEIKKIYKKKDDGPTAEEQKKNKLERAIEKIESDDASYTAVKLSGSHIGSKGLERVAAALAQNTNVTNLYLQSCKIGDKGASALGKVLKTHPSVCQVNLGTNKITDKGGKSLLKALKANENINLLDVKANKLTYVMQKEFNQIMKERKVKWRYVQNEEGEWVYVPVRAGEA